MPKIILNLVCDKGDEAMGITNDEQRMMNNERQSRPRKQEPLKAEVILRHSKFVVARPIFLTPVVIADDFLKRYFLPFD